MGNPLQTSKKLTSLNDMFGSSEEENKKDLSREIELSKLVPFSRHPFRLYEGARLEDMVRSVKEMGVLAPILVREKKDGTYEILSGHNRWNAARQVGLDKVPAHILEDIDDDEAMLIVTETNLIQRSFNELLPSERAYVLSEHHKALKCQGKRQDLINEIKMLLNADEQGAEVTSGPLVQKLDSRDQIAGNYDMSGRTVARYLRINMLPDKLKEFVDAGVISIRAGVEISYLNIDNQSYLAGFLENGEKLDVEKAKKLHELQKTGKLNEINMEKILDGTYNPRKQKSILKGFKVDSDVMRKYFTEEQSEKDIQDILKKALELFFSQGES